MIGTVAAIQIPGSVSRLLINKDEENFTYVEQRRCRQGWRQHFFLALELMAKSKAEIMPMRSINWFRQTCRPTGVQNEHVTVRFRDKVVLPADFTL